MWIAATLERRQAFGSLHPRVQKAGPEHLGIVAVDCAKDRSKGKPSHAVLRGGGDGNVTSIPDLQVSHPPGRPGLELYDVPGTRAPRTRSSATSYVASQTPRLIGEGFGGAYEASSRLATAGRRWQWTRVFLKRLTGFPRRRCSSGDRSMSFDRAAAVARCSLREGTRQSGARPRTGRQGRRLRAGGDP